MRFDCLQRVRSTVLIAGRRAERERRGVKRRWGAREEVVEKSPPGAEEASTTSSQAERIQARLRRNRPSGEHRYVPGRKGRKAPPVEEGHRSDTVLHQLADDEYGLMLHLATAGEAREDAIQFPFWGASREAPMPVRGGVGASGGQGGCGDRSVRTLLSTTRSTLRSPATISE